VPPQSIVFALVDQFGSHEGLEVVPGFTVFRTSPSELHRHHSYLVIWIPRLASTHIRIQAALATGKLVNCTV
jgi:hypothetical protein